MSHVAMNSKAAKAHGKGKSARRRKDAGRKSGRASGKGERRRAKGRVLRTVAGGESGRREGRLVGVGPELESARGANSVTGQIGGRERNGCAPPLPVPIASFNV